MKSICLKFRNLFIMILLSIMTFETVYAGPVVIVPVITLGEFVWSLCLSGMASYMVYSAVTDDDMWQGDIPTKLDKVKKGKVIKVDFGKNDNGDDNDKKKKIIGSTTLEDLISAGLSSSDAHVYWDSYCDYKSKMQTAAQDNDETTSGMTDEQYEALILHRIAICNKAELEKAVKDTIVTIGDLKVARDYSLGNWVLGGTNLGRLWSDTWYNLMQNKTGLDLTRLFKQYTVVSYSYNTDNIRSFNTDQFSRFMAIANANKFTKLKIVFSGVDMFYSRINKAGSYPDYPYAEFPIFAGSDKFLFYAGNSNMNNRNWEHGGGLLLPTFMVLACAKDKDFSISLKQDGVNGSKSSIPYVNIGCDGAYAYYIPTWETQCGSYNGNSCGSLATTNALADNVDIVLPTPEGETIASSYVKHFDLDEVTLPKFIPSVTFDIPFSVPRSSLQDITKIGVSEFLNIPSVFDFTGIASGTVPMTDVQPVEIPVNEPVPGADGAIDVSGIIDAIHNLPDKNFLKQQNDSSLDFTPLKVSLADRFPFCLPFDLYNAFAGFSATSEVPKFNVDFDKGLVGKASFTIDFEPFTNVAAILRYFILIGFIVFLIQKTRSLIGG